MVKIPHTRVGRHGKVFKLLQQYQLYKMETATTVGRMTSSSPLL